jgi:mannose-6-phosphate isomerase-like protein (cupin superfamily)
MQFVLVRYARHGETRKHIHPDQVQLYYVVSGRATVAIDRSEIVLGPGCFAHIPPDEPHGFRNEADEPLLLLDVHSYCFENEAPTTLSLETLAIEPGRSEDRPVHGDREVAYFGLDGEGTASVADETMAIGPNSLVFVPRGTACRLAADRGVAFRLLAVTSLPDAAATSRAGEAVPVISPMITSPETQPASRSR